MPWLVAIVANVVGFFVSWIIKYFTKRVAISVGFVATFLVFLSILVTTLYGIAQGLTYYLPEQLTIAASWVVPANTPVCLSAIITTRIVKYAWDFTMVKLNYLYPWTLG